MAHELGHTMQSYFSNKTQPYPAGRLSDLRRRGRVDVQRGAAHRLHAEDDQGRRDEAVAARQLSRGHQGHRLPADAVRGVRAAHARDGGEGRAADRRRARRSCTRRSRRSTTATTRASASSTTTSQHEWAFIPHFYRNFYVFQYATSFTASAALSEKVHGRRPGGDEALPRRSSAPAARNTRSICSRMPAST